MNVADWLCNLGMGRYTAAFKADDITAPVLRYLTADDLKDLGVASIGHRRVFIEAIAAMRASDAGEEPGHAHKKDQPVVLALGTIAERRQLSVMFCDLVDSTELSSRLDPEDLSTIFRAYQGCVTTAVARFGGFVARFVGDGALAYFGWSGTLPIACFCATAAGIYTNGSLRCFEKNRWKRAPWPRSYWLITTCSVA